MTTANERNQKQPSSDPLEGRRPWIRLDDAQIVEDRERSGEFQVTISGHNLKMAISPPRVSVGGIELEHLSFEPGGKQITGVLRNKPGSDEVIVDYGFASGAATATWQEDPKP